MAQASYVEEDARSEGQRMPTSVDFNACQQQEPGFWVPGGGLGFTWPSRFGEDVEGCESFDEDSSPSLENGSIASGSGKNISFAWNAESAADARANDTGRHSPVKSHDSGQLSQFLSPSPMDAFKVAVRVS
jgi:hypothetical protein